MAKEQMTTPTTPGIETSKPTTVRRRGLVAGAAALVAGLMVRSAETERVAAITYPVNFQADIADAPTNSIAARSIALTARNDFVVADGAVLYVIATNVPSGANLDGIRAYGNADYSGVAGFNLNSSANGVGVFGLAHLGTGLVGNSEYGTGVIGNGGTSGIGGEGVRGYAHNDKAGVAGFNFDNNYNAIGTYGRADYATGVYGSSGTGSGTVGRSDSGNGVYGVTFGTGNSGVLGQGNGGATHGVTGDAGASGGYGVYGNANAGIGVYGISRGGANPFGVVGSVTHAPGFALFGIASVAGTVGFAAGASVAGAIAGQFSGPVNIYNTSGSIPGNLYVQGSSTVSGTKSAAVPHPDGSHRLLYCVESPEAWFEDFGKGALSGGKAEVKLDPDFAAVVDTSTLHVFLTPHDETHHLAVKATSGGGFSVAADVSGTAAARGTKATDINGSFTYRVVAKRKDVKAERLAKFDVPKQVVLPAPPVPEIPTAPKLVVPPVPPVPPTPTPSPKK